MELERDRLLGEARQRRRAEDGSGGALKEGAAFHRRVPEELRTRSLRKTADAAGALFP
jgi:hypothetical protein